jgi:hypothetical protein
MHPIQVVVVQGPNAGACYARRPVELFLVDEPSEEFAALHSHPLRDLPKLALEALCTRSDPHRHRGDYCPLGVPEDDEDDDEELTPAFPGPGVDVPAELRAILERQRQAFIEHFGREPHEGEPIFFDRSADTPQPINEEVLEQRTAEAMHDAGIHPALIYAYQKTGRILSEDVAKTLSPAERKEWADAVDEWYATHPDEDLEEPESDAEEPESAGQWTTDDVLSVIANPLHAGVSPWHPRTVPAEDWVKAAAKAVNDPDTTPERFFRVLLKELGAGLRYAADHKLKRLDGGP